MFDSLHSITLSPIPHLPLLHPIKMKMMGEAGRGQSPKFCTPHLHWLDSEGEVCACGLLSKGGVQVEIKKEGEIHG